MDQQAIEQPLVNTTDPSPQESSHFPKTRPRRPTRQLPLKDPNTKNNISLWTLEENLLYVEFLKEQGHMYELDREKLKVYKINVRMSRVVKTRSSDQCRSHHQKMMKYHDSIKGIIAHVKEMQEKEKEKVSADEVSSKVDEEAKQEALVKEEPSSPAQSQVKVEQRSLSQQEKQVSVKGKIVEPHQQHNFSFFGGGMYHPFLWNSRQQLLFQPNQSL